MTTIVQTRKERAENRRSKLNAFYQDWTNQCSKAWSCLVFLDFFRQQMDRERHFLRLVVVKRGNTSWRTGYRRLNERKRLALFTMCTLFPPVHTKSIHWFSFDLLCSDMGHSFSRIQTLVTATEDSNQIFQHDNLSSVRWFLLQPLSLLTTSVLLGRGGRERMRGGWKGNSNILNKDAGTEQHLLNLLCL